MKKRLAAALCALVLLAGIAAAVLLPAGASRASVYFMSVNDTVLDLEDETMPIFSGGVLYVPYTMFDPDFAGASLGVFSSYSRSKGAVLIYGWEGTLLFDLFENTSTFKGVTYRDSAIIRNSMVFVPVDLVCTCFGLEWSWLLVEQGYVIRVTNSSAALSDREFASAAYNTLNERYRAYLQGKEPIQSPSPSPSPSHSVDPSPSPSHSTPPPPSADDAQLRFAFRMEEGGATGPIAAELAYYDAYALFLCRPEELAGRDDEVRALVAAGHRVGLILDAESPEDRQAQLALGRELLAHIARISPSVCLADGVEGTEGLLLWPTTVDGTVDGRALTTQIAAVTRAVVDDSEQFILMDDSPQSAEALESILIVLSDQGCEFPPVHDVDLAPAPDPGDISP